MAKRSSEEVFARRANERPGLADGILDLVGRIPTTRESPTASPDQRVRKLARSAAIKAASTAGALALPPGPLGWVTIAPELYTVWRVQAQLVADIAGVYGKHPQLNREQMLYCLFGHTAAGAFGDLVLRVGERYLVRQPPLPVLYAVANKISIRIAQRSLGRAASRWLPAIGALGVAGYVYFDSGRVSDTAIELFSSDIEIESIDGPAAEPEATPRPKRAGSKATASAKAGRGAGAGDAAGTAAGKSASRKPARRKATPKGGADGG